MPASRSSRPSSTSATPHHVAPPSSAARATGTRAVAVRVGLDHRHQLGVVGLERGGVVPDRARSTSYGRRPEARLGHALPPRARSHRAGASATSPATVPSPVRPPAATRRDRGGTRPPTPRRTARCRERATRRSRRSARRPSPRSRGRSSRSDSRARSRRARRPRVRRPLHERDGARLLREAPARRRAGRRRALAPEQPGQLALVRREHRIALRSASDVASASNAFSASASTTSGTGEVRTTSRTNDAVAGCRDRPGPIATAWASPAALTTASTASGAIDPASVSGSGRNTASVSSAWTTGRIDAGSATTT